MVSGRKSFPSALASTRPTGMPLLLAMVTARAANGSANSYCTHAGSSVPAAGMFTAELGLSSINAFPSIGPAPVVTLGFRLAMATSPAGVRKASTALSP